MIQIQRVDVLGSMISAADMGTAIAAIEGQLSTGSGGYVCFTNAHTAVMGRRDPEYRAITNHSFLSLADGKPVYWMAHQRSMGSAGHTPGPDLMLEAFRALAHRRHFLYGSSPEVLGRLRSELQAAFPGASICGVISPPFRELTNADLDDHCKTIRDAEAELVWVGLGAPKQEQWMARVQGRLPKQMLLGVGAAFDFHAGTAARAPAWMRRTGLEWLFRLTTNPRRLWRRYLVTNCLFIWYALRASPPA